jgi:PAS domain S-box-containing protein
MLESELFSLLERTADAAFTVTRDGEIRSWNAAAVQLFGHAADEVIGERIDVVLGARDALGTAALAGGEDASTRHWSATSGGIANFDLDVATKSGERIRINVSTIIFDDARQGHRLFVRLARDVTGHRRREALLGRMVGVAREVISLDGDDAELAPVEALSDQERRILTLFAHGKNAAAVARELGISPQTLRNHLHRINRKLRTHSRLEAVTHARLRGLID